LIVSASILLSCGWIARSWGQNPSILNPGFESFSTAPTSPGQWFFATHWDNAGSTDGDPDFFHVDGFGGGDLPETPVALVEPHGGEGVMGFIAAKTDGSNRREYVVGRFSEPLLPGARYRLGFSITNGEPTPFSQAGAAVSDLGIAGFETAPTQVGLSPLETVPTFTIPSPLYNREWQDVSFVFTAPAAWNHFAIGVFASDMEVTMETEDGEAPLLAYYFVDDFFLELAAEGLEEVAEDRGPNQSAGLHTEVDFEPEAWFVPNAFSPNEDGDNDQFTPVLNAAKLIRFEVYSRWGELLHEASSEEDLAWDGTDARGNEVPFGMYVWKLKMQLETGERAEESGMLTLIR